jgi:O-antigen/teichoic acid export membrane protein
MKLLAVFSVGSALASVVFSYVGGEFWGLYGVSVGLMLAQCLYFFLVAYSILKKINIYRCVVVPLIVSLLTVVMGAVYYYALNRWFGFSDWRVASLLWLVGFAGMSLVALWKGVRWSEFAR